MNNHDHEHEQYHLLGQTEGIHKWPQDIKLHGRDSN